MASKSKQLSMTKLLGVIIASIILGGTGLIFTLGYLGQQAGVLPDVTGDVPDGYEPYVLTTIFLKIMDGLDKDAGFGANDIYGRTYKEGDFDWTGTHVDISTSYTSASGFLNFTGSAMFTGSTYDLIGYQGDGGTNLYTLRDELVIAPLTGDKTTWTATEDNGNGVRVKVFYMYQEGAFASTAADCTQGNGTAGLAVTNWDESSNDVTLNKTLDVVQGCNKWDITIGNTVAGSILKNPVIVFEEDASDTLTDIEDIEEIYLSVKSGSGVSVPSGNLKSQFRNAEPIPIAKTGGTIGSGDSATVTLTICLPAAEASVGTGTMIMYLDDLGDYRVRDNDQDVRAAAEETEFIILT